MKTLQLIVVKLLCLVVLLLGIALWFYSGDELRQALTSRFPGAVVNLVSPAVSRTVFGVVLAAVGLFGLLPAFGGRGKAKTIAFTDAHGKTTLRLDAIESGISRDVSKLPGVKHASITIIPVDDNRRVRLTGRMVLLKGADDNLREIEASVKGYVMDQARRILGRDEVVGLDLTVTNVLVSKKNITAPSPKNAPLLQQAEEEEYEYEDEEEEIEEAPAPVRGPRPHPVYEQEEEDAAYSYLPDSDTRPKTDPGLQRPENTPVPMSLTAFDPFDADASDKRGPAPEEEPEDLEETDPTAGIPKAEENGLPPISDDSDEDEEESRQD
jgi:hypothetical protein